MEVSLTELKGKKEYQRSTGDQDTCEGSGRLRLAFKAGLTNEERKAYKKDEKCESLSIKTSLQVPSSTIIYMICCHLDSRERERRGYDAVL